METRESHHAAARAIVDRAKAEKRELTMVENALFENHLKAIDALDASKPSLNTSGATTREQGEVLRALARGDIQTASFEVRALVSGTATVPETFADFVAEQLGSTSPVFAAAQAAGAVITTTSGETLRIPTLTVDQSSALVPEAGTASVSDPTITSVQLGAFKLVTMQRVSDELLRDQALGSGGLEALLGRAAGRSLGLQAGSYFTLGTGTVEPTGFLSAISASSTASGTPFWDLDDVVGLFYGLAPAYRADAIFMASPSAMLKLARSKSADGVYLWQPSLVAGQPASFMGRPIYENVHMATVGSASTSLAVYSASSFLIRQAGSIEVARSSDVWFTSGEVAFKYSWRVDSAMPIAAAGVKLVCGAS